MLILAPSMLSANFSNLTAEIKKIEDAGAKYLHLDVMDGHFVPNLTFGAPVIKSLRPVTNLIFDVHLMIENPEKYLEDFAKAGADILNFHIETVSDAKAIIEKIRSLNCKVGITIKPATPLTEIEEYLHLVDMVLVMTVNPGFSGQSFMRDAFAKIPQLVKIREDKNLNFDIQIDGGVDLNNLKEVVDAGANIIVAGSAVFGAADVSLATTNFMNIFKEIENK